MAQVGLDCVAIRIDMKIQAQIPIPPELCMFKVPRHIRKVNENAYEPELVAIGPYHHGKDHLNPMEEHKMRYLGMLLHRRMENTVDRYVMELRALEGKARDCYEAESISKFSRDEFVEMLLLDGFFVVELMRKQMAVNRITYENDPVFRLANALRLKQDLLLLENQILFFVLSKLFHMTTMENEKKDFGDVGFYFFQGLLRGQGRRGQQSEDEIPHLLGLMHNQWLPLHEKMGARHKIYITVPCATELQQAGIEFRKIEGNFFDIKFEKGIIKMAAFVIDNSIECTARNLVAYEQFSGRENPKHVTDYMLFLGCLINSAEDVELLCRRGIIVRPLGDNEMVATLVNKLCENVYFLHSGSIYADIYNGLNIYCQRRWNLWMARLRQEYFNTPWAFISLMAAVVLLLLTSTQTVCSFIPCQKK